MARLSWIKQQCDAVELDDLTFEAEGFFHRLRRFLGRRGGRLPADLKKLAKLLGEDIRVVRRLWDLVKKFFVVTAEHVREHGVDEDMARLEKAVRPDFGRKCPHNPLKTNEPLTDIDISLEPRGSRERVDAKAPTPPPSAASSCKQKRKQGRARPIAHQPKTPLPDGYQPSAAGRLYAQQRGFDDAWIDRATRKFCIHFGGKPIDAERKWRMWVEREIDRQLQFPGHVDRHERARQQMRERRQWMARSAERKLAELAAGAA